MREFLENEQIELAVGTLIQAGLGVAGKLTTAMKDSLTTTMKDSLQFCVRTKTKNKKKTSMRDSLSASPPPGLGFDPDSEPLNENEQRVSSC